MFLERLKYALEKSELSQADIARYLKVSQPSVNAWFHGKSRPDVGRVGKLAKLLGIDLTWLMTGAGEMYAGDGIPGSDAPSDAWDEDDVFGEYEAAWRIVHDVMADGVPVNLGRICQRLNMEVVQVEAVDTFCGGIRRTNDRYQISLNANHHPNRQRFTLAHEIVHYLEHRHQIGDGIIDDELRRSGLSTGMEVEANRLAAEILMPDEILEKAFLDEEPDLEKLARQLRVSKQALAIRLGVPNS